MVYRHKEADATYGKEGGIKSNKNGGRGYEALSHHNAYPQSWEKPVMALESTPYSKYQDSIQNRNKASEKKNLNMLKQD